MPTAAYRFVECLENEGVEYVFGLPGEENLDLMEALRQSKKIKFVLARHEQGAAFMADVYGRLTGRAGVCLSTLGPGATNLITGVADANMDRAPVVAITGQANVKREHKESHQYIDVVNAFRPITKWNARVSHTNTISEIVRKAFRLAQMEKQGATHIEISETIAGRELKPDDPNLPIKFRQTPKSIPSKEDIMEAVNLIKNAKRAIVLAGNGAVRSGASKALTQFCEKNNISAATTFMAKGVISARSDLYVATIGLQAKDFVMCGFDRADLIITVGYDLVEYSPKFWNLSRKKKIIHIDSTPAEVDKYYTAAVEVIGDIAITLGELTALTGFKKEYAYLEKLKKIAKDEYRHLKDSDSFPVKPQKILYDLRHALGDKDIVLSDVGMHKLWIARQYPAYEPNTVIISNGFASMGISLPGAVAAKLVHPDQKVVSVCGDGGFLMNSQELETARRLGLAFVVIIFNDGKYGMIEWKQVNQFGKAFSTEFTNPDFVKYAESFGCVGMRVEKTGDLLPMLKKALSIDNVVVIDVPVDYTENFELTNKLGKLVCPL